MASDAPLIISISGIRGVVGSSLTGAVVRRFAAAYGGLLPTGSRVVLGRDTRPSGEELSREAAEGLMAAGCVALDLGRCSTPAAKLMVTELGAEAGIILTASHNPAPWNGLKLVRADGVFLNAAQGARVESAFRAGDTLRRAGGRTESVGSDEVGQRYLDRILSAVDVERIRDAGLRVAADPCNGAGALLLPELFTRLGVTATLINAAPDGCFAHEPEPVPENLEELSRAVCAAGASVGFAVDPDADRVALVGGDGVPVGEDYTLALAVQAVMEDASRPGPVVTTLSTSQIVSDAAARMDRPVMLTPVGEVHVVERMLEEGAAIGGEGNGGVILTEIVPGRDAALGIALVLQQLATAGKTLTELVADLPRYAIDKRKVVGCTATQLERGVEALRRRHPQAYVHPVRDGVKLYLSGSLECPWIHLRASNTEPIVRVIAESASAQEASHLCSEAEELLGRV